MEIAIMSRLKKELLRSLTDEERTQLERFARSPSQSAVSVARAKSLLAVAEGKNYTQAAQAAGRKSGDAVSHLVTRFNQEGIASLHQRHGGGPSLRYQVTERETILAEARRAPDRELDGTATWSLSTLQRALRKKGLTQISTYTIWHVLKEAGLGWQTSRAWCETGTSWRVRRRKSGNAQSCFGQLSQSGGNGRRPRRRSEKKTDRISLQGGGTTGTGSLVRG